MKHHYICLYDAVGLSGTELDVCVCVNVCSAVAQLG